MVGYEDAGAQSFRCLPEDEDAATAPPSVASCPVLGEARVSLTSGRVLASWRSSQARSNDLGRERGLRREKGRPGEGASLERGRRREKGGVSEPSPSLRSRRRRQPPFFWGRKGIRECCGCVDDFGTARVRGKWPARFDIGLKFWPRQRGKDATAKSVTDI